MDERMELEYKFIAELAKMDKKQFAKIYDVMIAMVQAKKESEFVGEEFDETIQKATTQTNQTKKTQREEGN